MTDTTDSVGAEPDADRIARLENEIAEASRAALVARIQAQHRLSDEQAELFLTGADTDSLTKQAEALASLGERQKARGPYSPREGDARGEYDGPKEDLREFTSALFRSAHYDY